MPSNIINNRAEFIDWCLRKLGRPVVTINVAPEQIEDRVDEAIQYWQDYYYEGTQTFYLKYQITQTDIDNKYIPVSDADKIISINRILTGQLDDSSSSLWSVNYQFRLQEFWNFTDISMIHYNMVMNHLDLLDFMLNVKWTFQFSRYEKKIYINWDWSTFPKVGDWIVFETTLALSPDNIPGIWNDRWLKEYATQLIKQQWGRNLLLFNNLQIPGGAFVNAQDIINEANEEIKELQERLRSGLDTNPLGFLIG